MREIKFKVWHRKENKMYYRGYQKISHVLLCRDDEGKAEGKGFPVLRASYADCDLLESTGVEDKNHKEIFEGDILRIKIGTKTFQGVLEGIPDMFRSRRLHPLHELLEQFGIADDEQNLEFEILGNRYENSELLLNH